jgi:hypothetical protein
MRFILQICVFVLTTNMVQSQAINSDVTPEVNPKAPRVSIYPNPAQDYFQIKTNNSLLKLEEVHVYNINGRRVKRLNGQNKTLDIADLKTGVYLVQTITESDETITKKLVKL